MKDGLSDGVDKSRAGVEQLLDASRRLGEVLSQSGDVGARASDKYNSKLVGLRQGVEKMSASLKAMGVSEKETAGVLMKSSEQNLKFVEAQAGRLRSMEDALRSALESGNTALAETTKAEMEQLETWMDDALSVIQKSAEQIPAIVQAAYSQVPDQQTESMRAQLRLLTNEIASTTVEYRRMTEAERNSAEGLELKHKLETLIKKAGELRDAMDDANTQIRGEASDTKHLDGIAQGLNVVSSSAGAAVSVFQMFGASQEELINIQTKLQATLAISNALTVIQNNLQKESSLMMGIRTIQEKAHTAAITLRTAAEGRGIIVTKLATIAQSAFNVVAKANPYVLLATAILTVTGALVAFTLGSKEATAAEKRRREEGERLRKQQEDMSRALGESAGNVESKYRSLQQQWSRLKTESEKNKWIKENANKFHELGLNVNSVADAEQVLVNMAPQVIAALKAVAEAEAYNDLYKQAIKERAAKWEHRVKSRATGDYYTKASKEQGSISEAEKAYLKSIGYKSTKDDMHAGDFSDPLIGNGAVKTQRAIDAVNAYRKQKALETNRALRAGYDEDVDFYADKWEQAEQKARKSLGKIPSRLRWSGNTEAQPRGGKIKHTGEHSSSRMEEPFELELKLRQEQAKQLQESENAMEAARIARISNAGERERAERANQYRLSLQQIANKEEEMRLTNYEAMKSKWESGKNKTNWASSAIGKDVAQNGLKNIKLTEAQEKQLAAEREKTESDFTRYLLDLYTQESQYRRDYLKEFGSYEQQRLAIVEEYEEKIREAATPTQKALAELTREKSLKDLADRHFAEQVDWSGVFSDLQGHTKEYLSGLREQLESVVKEGSLTPEQLSVVQAKLRDISDEISKQNGLFDYQGDRARERARREKETTDARSSLSRAQGAEQREHLNRNHIEKEARALLGKLGINMDTDLDDEILTQIDVNSDAYRQMKSLLADLRVSEGRLAQARKDTAEATRKAKEAEDKSKTTLSQSVSDWFLDAQQFISEKGIDQLPGLLDSLGFGELGKKAQAGLDAFSSASGAASDFASHNYIGAASKVIAAFKSLTSALGLGDNHAEMQKKIDDLNFHSELLAQSMERLKESFDRSYGASSIEKASEMKAVQSQRELDASRALQAEADKHGFLANDLHRSVGDNWVWQQAMRQVSLLLGKNIITSRDFLSLSGAEMKQIQSVNGGQLWFDILNEYRVEGGTKGRSDQLASMLNTYVNEFGDAIEEIDDRLREKLTTTTRDDVFGSFLDSLYELADGSSDVMGDIADNWQKMLNKMALNNLVGAKFQKNLEDWYERLYVVNKDRTDGLTDDTVWRERLASLKSEYEGYVASAQRDIEVLRSEGIVKSTSEGAGQSGRAGGMTAMSQDQGTKLEGLFVSGQMHWASIDESMVDVSRQMGEASEHLRAIETHTGESASSLVEIRDEIKRMIRDGLKVR